MTCHGCGSCARMRLPVFAKSAFQPLTTKTGGSPTSLPSRRLPFRLTRNGRARLSRQELEPYRVTGVACQLVFVNGRFARELSLLGKLPDGVKVSSLAGEIASNPGSD